MIGRFPRPRVLAAVLLSGILAGGVALGGSADAAPSAEQPPTTAAPSGVALPRGDTRHWKQVVAQDFVRPAALGSFARVYPGWAGYDGNRDTSRDTGRPLAEQGLWSSSTTTSVSDGLLDCRLHTEGRTPQVCAITPTASGAWWKGRRYGRYVVRFRADRTPGYKVAWLLWPQSDRWKDGEIDFPEGALDGTVTGAAHLVGDPEWTPKYFDTGTSMQRWHTAVISWRPGRLTFRLDHRSWTTTKASVLPKVRMRWALQAETSITAKPPGRTVTGDIHIDWVAAYRWVP